MRKRLLFIYNPSAGRSAIKRHLDDVTDIFEKHGYQVGLYRTKASEDAKKEVMANATHFDRIVCSGGDGTLSEVVSAMMTFPPEERIPIGFIPAGSTNDTGKSYKLPKSVKEAAEIAACGVPFSTDIGRMNESFFTYVASFGKLSAVSCFTPRAAKKKFGHLAYIIEGIKVLLHLDAYDLKIRYTDIYGEEVLIEDNFFLGMMANTLSVGGFSNIMGNNVDLSDGIFEVVLCKRPKNLYQFSRLVDNIFLRTDKDISNEMVTKFKTSKISVECDNDLQWVIDGENGGRHKVVNIENENKAIDIIIADASENV